MTACVALPRTIPPRSAAPCHLLVTSPLHTDSRVMNSDYDFSMCGLCQHIVRPPPSLILVRSLGNSPSSTHSWVTPGRSIALGHHLRMYPIHVEEKVLMLYGAEFRLRLRMGTNTLSSVYKPLHEYRILQVSNSPHLCELCTTLTIIEQHIPLYMVLSFTKRPALP
ncbi:hypothetical protein GW17_00060754 [Ensete ventricosum]|nr:hypothetical protein GW17_00060754 [Ensete ventricosum]